MMMMTMMRSEEILEFVSLRSFTWRWDDERDLMLIVDDDRWRWLWWLTRVVREEIMTSVSCSHVSRHLNIFLHQNISMILFQVKILKISKRFLLFKWSDWTIRHCTEHSGCPPLRAWFVLSNNFCRQLHLYKQLLLDMWIINKIFGWTVVHLSTSSNMYMTKPT